MNNSGSRQLIPAIPSIQQFSHCQRAKTYCVPNAAKWRKKWRVKRQKKAVRLWRSQSHRYCRTGRFNGKEGLSGYRASCGSIYKSVEDQI